MKISDYLYLISTITAVVSIFISNYLGRKSQQIELNNKILLERYENFYIPIIEKLYKLNPEVYKTGLAHTLLRDLSGLKEKGHADAHQQTWLHKNIKENIRYATPELLNLYYEYWKLLRLNPQYDHSLMPGTEDFDVALKKYDKIMYKNDLDIIVQVLEEAQVISSKLKLPNISKTLLNVLKY